MHVPPVLITRTNGQNEGGRKKTTPPTESIVALALAAYEETRKAYNVVKATIFKAFVQAGDGS